MINEQLNATDVLGWLADQELLYASWPASGDKSIKLIYLPRIAVWKVVLGGKLLYAGDSLNRAIEVFNINAE